MTTQAVVESKTVNTLFDMDDDSIKEGTLSPQLLEDLQKRQKAEIKELQAKIQSLKHSVPKGDKKKKKQITAEIALLEAEQNERHSQELRELEGKDNEGGKENHQVEDTENNEEKEGPKLSRAQKRRNKKEAEEKERQEYIAAAEKDSALSTKHIELTSLTKCLDSLSLEIHEVAPDGNCLFAAIASQIADKCKSGSVEYLRKLAADYMRLHQDDFLPFLVDPQTGDIYTEDGFHRYCLDMEVTSAWGGQAEIKAISQALEIPVEIYQADAPVIKIGEEFDGEPVRLSYHRHAYGLGEHYNAVTRQIRRKSVDDTD